MELLRLADGGAATGAATVEVGPKEEAGGGATLILGALPNEVAGVRRALSSRKTLHLDGLRLDVGLVEGPRGPSTVVVAATGIGRARALAAFERAAREFPPARVLSVGFCGACRDGIGTGQLVLGEPLLNEPAAEVVRADPALLESVRRAAREAGVALVEGPCVTVNVIASPGAKRSLFEHSGAIACEMEGHPLALASRARGTPFAALYSVFDTVDEALPNAAGLGTEPFIHVVARRPGILLAVPGLALRFMKASRALTRALRAWLGAL